MNKRLAALSLSLAFVVGAFAWLAAKGVGKIEASPRADNELPAPYARVEEKARALRGGEAKPIRELADAVFRPEIAELPFKVVGPFKERFIRAEIDYRGERRAGITEASVVRAFNELAQTFDAPDFAKTNEAEIRGLRLTISRHMPHFIARHPVEGAASAGGEDAFTVGDAMSPLEAAYVVNYLVLQKKNNSWFQLTAEERADIKRGLRELDDSKIQLTGDERISIYAALVRQKLSGDEPERSPEELAAMVKNGDPALRVNMRAPQLSGSASPREKEMEEVFARASALSFGDAQKLAERLVNLLGV